MEDMLFYKIIKTIKKKNNNKNKMKPLPDNISFTTHFSDDNRNIVSPTKTTN